LPGDLCTAVDGCGSPLRGDCFHEYAGPLTDFTSLCFVCGKKPKFGVRVSKLLRPIGVCEAHIVWLQGNPKTADTGVPLKLDGVPVAPPKKKTVWEAVEEADAYFDEQDRKKNGGDL
jgi:hypothetical protein